MSHRYCVPATLATNLLNHCTSNSAELASYMKRVVTAETNLVRVNMIYEDLKKYNLFPKLVQDTKNDSLAISYRESGNRYFKAGKYLRALEEYTRSIATSNTPEVTALAYANRSACLFSLNRHKDCIVDIDRALANNYPNKLIEKVAKRREQAVKLQKLQEKYHEEVPKILEFQKNPLIQCASNCVKIEFNEEYGRHVVATRDIEIGEVIVVEKPFACALKEDQLIHCHHCMELCYNPIPCNSCTQALFCGEACKDQAQIYHKYECLILLKVADEGFGIMKGVVRAALLGKSDYEKLKTYCFDKNDYYRSDRYKEIYCLNRKPPLTSLMTSGDRELLLVTIMTATVFHWLENTDLFENDNIKDHFKEVVLSQFQIFILNGIMITEFTANNELGDNWDVNAFGEGIYSFTSLFSHSCCPNILRYYYGATVVLRAINTIKEGEQCFINYGSAYRTDPKDVRQLTLMRKYLFTCKCKACEYDWKPGPTPSGDKLVPEDCRDKIFLNTYKMSEADLVFAKEILPYYVEELKLYEHTEPSGFPLGLKEIINRCYNIMGNKRRI